MTIDKEILELARKHDIYVYRTGTVDLTIKELQAFAVACIERGRKQGLEEAKKVLEDVETVQYTFGGQTYDSVSQTLGNAIDAIEVLKG